jgi:hypothetical protein
MPHIFVCDFMYIVTCRPEIRARSNRKGIARSAFYVVRIYPLLGNGCVFYVSASRQYK